MGSDRRTADGCHRRRCDQRRLHRRDRLAHFGGAEFGGERASPEDHQASAIRDTRHASWPGRETRSPGQTISRPAHPTCPGHGQNNGDPGRPAQMDVRPSCRGSTRMSGRTSWTGGNSILTSKAFNPGQSAASCPAILLSGSSPALPMTSTARGAERVGSGRRRSRLSRPRWRRWGGRRGTTGPRRPLAREMYRAKVGGKTWFYGAELKARPSLVRRNA
jgi:hypothetical protein